jgi:ADP-ribose pyrophosphatase YjhB (NUDIX family)
MADREHSAGDWPPRLVVCVGTVVVRDGQVLFIRQAKGHSLEGQWSVPWGIVDPDEAPEAAALRETKEEGGIDAEIQGLLGVQNLRQAGWIALVYLCQHVSGEPQHDGGVETDGAAYFSLEEMDAFDEPFESWCEWVVRRVLREEHKVIPPEPLNPYKPRMAFM